MKKQIPLIALAVFSILILLAQNNINQVYALTITVKTFGSTALSNEWHTCEYISATEVWCATSTGIKVWNPTAQSVTTTLKSSGDFDDIKCTSLVCYGWEASTVTGNLTRWIVSGRTLDTFFPFIGNSGFVTGHGIGLVAGGSENTLLLPVEGQTCVDGVTPLGGTNEKGVCLWNGGSGVLFNGDRFITSSQTNDLHVIYDIEWNEGTGLFGNRALVKQVDSAGVFQWQLLNLADGDSTFSTNRICQTSSLTGTTQQSKIVIIDGKLYDTYDTSDLLVMDTTLDTCATSAKLNLIDENIVVTTTYSSQDDVFIISGRTLGAVETNGLYVFNGSNFDTITTSWTKILKVNLTASDTNWANWHFNHASEGEVHVWRGSSMVIVGDITTPEPEEGSGSGGGNNQNGVCGVGTVLDCIGDRSLSTAITGGEDISVVSGNLFCGVGLNATCSGNVDTNGTGLLLMLITGVFFAGALLASVATANSKFGAGISFTEIPKEMWLFLVVGVVAFSFYMGWIPDIVFYGMVVGLAGLFSFGLYKHIRG